MWFCFIRMKAAIKTASREVIADSNGKGSKGVIHGIFPAFTITQPPDAKICSATNAIVPTNSLIASVSASLLDRGCRASFSTRITVSMFSATDSGARPFDGSFIHRYPNCRGSAHYERLQHQVFIPAYAAA